MISFTTGPLAERRVLFGPSNQRTRIHTGGVRFCFPYHFIHQNHTPNVNRVNGGVVTTYTHHILETPKLGLPGPFVSRARKLVPKKLNTKVAGRYNIVRVAIVFIELLSPSCPVSNFCALFSNFQARDAVAIGCEIVQIYQCYEVLDSLLPILQPPISIYAEVLQAQSPSRV